jgi:hypothetical protein
MLLNSDSKAKGENWTCRACNVEQLEAPEPLFQPSPEARQASRNNLGAANPPEGNRKRKQVIRKGKDDVGSDSLGNQPTLGNCSQWVKNYDLMNGVIPLVPSAKIAAVKNQVLKWQLEAPDDKIISRSQVLGAELISAKFAYWEILLISIFSILCLMKILNLG